jgi:hypothetical protein
MSEREMPAAPNYERLKIAVDVWKHGISVQMHFNDIEMRIRNLYFTILAASLGLIGVVVGKHIQIPFFKMEISISVVVMVAVIPVSMLFYFMDRHWYHRLLQGAVAQCAEIERSYAAQLPEIQLGSKISQQSPVEFPGWWWKWIFFFVRDPRFRQNSRLHSDQKIEVLYKSVIWGAAAIAGVYCLIGGIQIKQCALLPYTFNWSCGASSSAPQAPALPVKQDTRSPGTGGHSDQSAPSINPPYRSD